MPNNKHVEAIRDVLRTPEDIVNYLNASLDDEAAFLIALRNITDINGMTILSRETGLNREHLYRALSEDGDPKLSSIFTILQTLGLKLSVETNVPINY